ncbi:MAG: hypothetical protein BWY75_00898 [bacterium ADurb.Bin425]|nr:MAG: hypothetical protein BWY75_00898 [bacterium ADurb.Bin425]
MIISAKYSVNGESARVVCLGLLEFYNKGGQTYQEANKLNLPSKTLLELLPRKNFIASNFRRPCPCFFRIE